MSQYVYIESERFRDDDGNLRIVYTVGFYKPDGSFESDSDYEGKEDAADRVAFLNGGIPYWMLDQLVTTAQRVQMHLDNS